MNRRPLGGGRSRAQLLPANKNSKSTRVRHHQKSKTFQHSTSRHRRLVNDGDEDGLADDHADDDYRDCSNDADAIERGLLASGYYRGERFTAAGTGTAAVETPHGGRNRAASEPHSPSWIGLTIDTDAPVPETTTTTTTTRNNFSASRGSPKRFGGGESPGGHVQRGLMSVFRHVGRAFSGKDRNDNPAGGEEEDEDEDRGGGRIKDSQI